MTSLLARIVSTEVCNKKKFVIDFSLIHKMKYTRVFLAPRQFIVIQMFALFKMYSRMLFDESMFLGLHLVYKQSPHFDYENFCFFIQDHGNVIKNALCIAV